MDKSRRKRSIIWSLPKEELRKIVNKCSSFKEVLQKIGMKPSCGNYKTLSVRINKDSICLDTINLKRTEDRQGRVKKHFSGNEIFVVNSRFDSGSIKKRFLALNVEYCCSDCGIGNVYNNKPIVLQLDHINGTNNDNRPENLRLLCPNCHSQTETFGTKGRKTLKKKYYCDCGKEKNIKAKECSACRNSNRETKIVWPDPSIIKDLIWKKSCSEVAKDLGVSDVTVSKFCKKHGIPKPPRGYWAKQNQRGISED